MSFLTPTLTRTHSSTSSSTGTTTTQAWQKRHSWSHFWRFACQNFQCAFTNEPTGMLRLGYGAVSPLVVTHPSRLAFELAGTRHYPSNGGSMQVFTDPSRNEVIIRGEAGNEIRLSWAAAANLSTILNEASRQAEPAARPGKIYEPVTERDPQERWHDTGSK